MKKVWKIENFAKEIAVAFTQNSCGTARRRFLLVFNVKGVKLKEFKLINQINGSM